MAPFFAGLFVTISVTNSAKMGRFDKKRQKVKNPENLDFTANKAGQKKTKISLSRENA